MPPIPERIKSPGTAVTVGVFDGVHLGHQELLRRTQLAAARQGLAALAFTFNRHPLTVLAPAYAPQALLRPGRKSQLLSASGMHHTVTAEFNEQFAAISPESFVHDILHQSCNCRHIVCGADFRFGHGGRADISHLRDLARRHGNFSIEVVDDVLLDGLAVRSTAVRDALLRGDVKLASHLLSRPHEIFGRVVGGLARGRTIGFPTANLHMDYDAVVPLRGVYVTAVRILRPDGSESPVLHAMTNVGFNPTFGLERLSIETHILNFDENLEGAQLEVFFLARLRDEQKFSGVEALRAQLEQDRVSSKTLLESGEVLAAIQRIPPALGIGQSDA